MKNQCQILIIDDLTKRKRMCKNKYKFQILGKKCCRIHAYNLYIKYIIKIQKVFRAYKLRKKIKYLIQLPAELQHKIIIFSKVDFYENKKNQKIAEIILNKIDIFIIKYFNIPHQINYLFGAIQFYNFEQNNYEEFYIPNTHPNANYLINHSLYLFYLLDKYQSIIVKQKKFYNFNYRSIYDMSSSMYYKLFSLQEKLLKCKNEIQNIENFKYIDCVLNFTKNFKKFY